MMDRVAVPMDSAELLMITALPPVAVYPIVKILTILSLQCHQIICPNAVRPILAQMVHAAVLMVIVEQPMNVAHLQKDVCQTVIKRLLHNHQRSLPEAKAFQRRTANADQEPEAHQRLAANLFQTLEANRIQCLVAYRIQNIDASQIQDLEASQNLNLEANLLQNLDVNFQ